MNRSLKLFLAVSLMAVGLSLALLFGRVDAPVSSAPLARQQASTHVESAGAETGYVWAEPNAGDVAELVPDPAPTAPPVVSAPALLPVEPPRTFSPTRSVRPLATLSGVRVSPAQQTCDVVQTAPSSILPVGFTASDPFARSASLPARDERPPLEPVPSGFAPALASMTPITPLAPAEPLRTHIVIDGDSLTRLAARYLDDPQRDDEIFRINSEVLTDPNLLPIGVELKIPALEPAGATAAAAVEKELWTDDSGMVPFVRAPADPHAWPHAQLLSPQPARSPPGIPVTGSGTVPAVGW